MATLVLFCACICICIDIFTCNWISICICIWNQFIYFVNTPMARLVPTKRQRHRQWWIQWHIQWQRQKTFVLLLPAALSNKSSSLFTPDQRLHPPFSWPEYECWIETKWECYLHPFPFQTTFFLSALLPPIPFITFLSLFTPDQRLHPPIGLCAQRPEYKCVEVSDKKRKDPGYPGKIDIFLSPSHLSYPLKSHTPEF